MQFLLKLQKEFHVQTNILNFIQKDLNPGIAKTIFTQKNKVLVITLPSIKAYSHSNQNMQYWQRSRHINQWNIVKNPQITLQMYAQLISTKMK